MLGESKMPIREFKCPKCLVITEKLIIGSDREAAICWKCGKEITKTVLSTCTFELKGGGWYADGYSRKRE